MTAIFRSTPFRLSLMMFFQYMLFAWSLTSAIAMSHSPKEGFQYAFDNGNKLLPEVLTSLIFCHENVFKDYP
jgi:hypothetical protein